MQLLCLTQVRPPGFPTRVIKVLNQSNNYKRKNLVQPPCPYFPAYRVMNSSHNVLTRDQTFPCMILAWTINNHILSCVSDYTEALSELFPTCSLSHPHLSVLPPFPFLMNSPPNLFFLSFSLLNYLQLFTNHISTHGTAMFGLWLREFSGVVWSCFTLSR